MDLKTYLSPLAAEKRDEFARRCGTTRGHLQNVMYGKKCAPKLAAVIWRESGRVVARESLRPADYWLIWPDLDPPAQANPAKRVKRPLPANPIPS